MIKFFVFLALLLGGVYYYLSGDSKVAVLEKDVETTKKKTQTIKEMAAYLDGKDQSAGDLPEGTEEKMYEVPREEPPESEPLDERAVQALMDGQAILESPELAVPTDPAKLEEVPEAGASTSEPSQALGEVPSIDEEGPSSTEERESTKSD